MQDPWLYIKMHLKELEREGDREAPSAARQVAGYFPPRRRQGRNDDATAAPSCGRHSHAGGKPGQDHCHSAVGQ